MTKKEIKRIFTETLTYDKLLAETESLNSPVIFSGIEDLYSLSEKWSNGYIQRIAKQIGCARGPLHSAAYWAQNPIQKMFESRSQNVDFNEFLNGTSYPRGSYYIGHHRIENGIPVSTRAFPQNKFDELISKDIPIFDFSKKAALILSWFSQGGTKSNLHSDPLHNLFFQIVGMKNIFLIKEKQNTFQLREKLVPHLLKIRDPYSREADEVKSFSDLDFYEFTLNPGEALFIPMWMFHHIEAPLAAINISMGYMFAPDLVDKLTSLDYWAAKFFRSWYPRLIAKRRYAFESSLLCENCVPFLKPGTQVVQQAAKNPDLVKDYPYYIFSNKIKPLPLSDLRVISMLLQIDGVTDIALIAEKCAVTESEIRNALLPFVANRFVGIYPKNGEGNNLNWRHQLNEII